MKVDASHVAIGGKSLEHRFLEVEVSLNAAWAEIEISHNDVPQVVVSVPIPD